MRGDRPPRNQRPAKPLKARAVALLARREYSRAEIRARLLASGGDDAEAAQVDTVLDELVALGYLSDARFAKTVVAHKIRSHGKHAISATLKARGVDDEAIAAAFKDSAIDDHSALVALWRRRYGKPPTDEREKARQVRFLQSRGFALSAILDLLRDPPVDTGSHDKAN